MQADSTPRTAPKTTPQRAAIYVRVSSRGQEDNYSPEIQEAACRAYAEGQGFAVAGVYQDAIDGEVVRRPQLTALLQVARRGEVEAVIFYKQDRLGRGEAFTVQKWRCKDAGLALHCVLSAIR